RQGGPTDRRPAVSARARARAPVAVACLDLLDAIRRATARSCAPGRRPFGTRPPLRRIQRSDAACHVPVLLGGLGPYQFRWVHGNRRPSNVPSVVRTGTPSTPLNCTVCVRLARLAQRMSPCPNEFLIWAPQTLIACLCERCRHFIYLDTHMPCCVY